MLKSQFGLDYRDGDKGPRLNRVVELKNSATPALLMKAIYNISLLLVILPLSVGPLAANEHPHIVLVMADDHGYGDCGYTGHPFVRTPNLDAMARQSVVFDRFYASSPVCSPTRAALLTGRHAFRVNVPNHGHYLRPHEVTIAEVLGANGYVTGHFGKWHIGSVQPDSPTSPGGQGFDEWLSGLNFFDNEPYLSRGGEYVRLKGAGTAIAADATIEFLTRHHQGGKPMFAVTWFPAPHDPFRELPEGIEKAASLYNEEAGKMAGYFREITLLDQQIGRLRAAIRKLGIAENTIFFYCSDNGGLVDATAGGRARKGSIYEGGLRVPALLEWPGTLEARKVPTPVSSCDILPTILAMAGVPFDPPHPLDGLDASGIITGSIAKRDPIGFWHGFRKGQSTWSDRIIKSLKEAQAGGKPNPFPYRILKNVEEFPEFEDGIYEGHAAWLDWPWKLHRIEKGENVLVELYDLSTDPVEKSNVREMHPARVAKMKSALESWQRSVLESWEGADYR